MLLTTRLNPQAMEAVQAGRAIGEGGMIVKLNYMPDSTLAATTVMYKVPGNDPQHQDWWWLKRNADETVEVAGRGQMCQSCHAQAPGNDYRYLEASSGGS